MPKLRFKGFTDDWEQRKLNNVTDVRDGTHDSPNYVEFGHPFITSKNVKDGYINYDDVQYISDNDFEQINRRSKVDVDDILMGMIGTIGNLALIREEADFAIKNVALIKHTGGANPFFLYSYLQADNVSKQLGNVLAGGTQNFISLRNIRELDVSIPNMQEQNKIGEYFASVDSFITLHQRKCDELQKVKKYMLQKMFPKKGEKVPEIRFAGFTGDWIQRKVGDITSVLSASRVHKDEWTDDGVPFYRSSDVVSAYKGTTNEKAFISKELYEFLAASSGKLEKDDILVTGGGSIGIPYVVPDDKPLYTKDADLIWVKKSALHDSKYLFAYLESPLFRDYLIGISHTGTISHYTIEQVKATPVAMPGIEEQRRIGSLFTRLDNLIALHQRKHETLKEIKKYMLQNMFPKK